MGVSGWSAGQYGNAHVLICNYLHPYLFLLIWKPKPRPSASDGGFDKIYTRLIRYRNCLPFESTCIHPWFLVGSVLLIFLVFWDFLFLLCLSSKEIRCDMMGILQLYRWWTILIYVCMFPILYNNATHPLSCEGLCLTRMGGLGQYF